MSQCSEFCAIIAGCKLTNAAQTAIMESMYDFIVNGITACKTPKRLQASDNSFNVNSLCCHSPCHCSGMGADSTLVHNGWCNQAYMM